ncbi:hypothetical protein V490_05237 [Pseudogymnoascus sp. VKM F-3557]|nr:hypothetical protein V490_05237 [Pseudogymnoascus sp. VKM F-3557]
MSTPGRYKAHEIDAMRIEDSLPMAKWVCPDAPCNYRLSDSFIGKLFSHCSIIEKKKSMATVLAPVTFTAKTLHIRTTGKVINLGSPFLYDGAYVTFNGHVLHGNWDPALLPAGRPLEQLVKDSEFEYYIQRVMFGDYHLFTPEILKSDLDLLRSVTSTSPGMIGSSNPPGPGPYFGIEPAFFAAAASVAPSSAASGGSQSPRDPSPPAAGGLHPSASVRAHSPADLSSAMSDSARSLSSAGSNDELILWPPPPSKISKAPQERPEAVSPQPLRRSERISRGPAGGYTTPLPSTPQFEPLTLPDRSVSPPKRSDVQYARQGGPSNIFSPHPTDIFGRRVTEIPSLMPRVPVEQAYHGKYTIPGRSREIQQFNIPEGWGGHARTVSMPNFPMSSGQSPTAMMPTRTYHDTHDEIASIIEAEYGHAPAENRLELPPRRHSIAKSNVTMGGMNDTTKLAQNLAPTSPGFAPTSPGFAPTSPPPYNMSPMSVARGSNSVESAGPQGAVYATYEEFHLRDTDSGDEARTQSFAETLRDVKQATRISARTAINSSRTYREARTKLEELDQELIYLMEAKFQALKEKRDAGGFPADH